MVVDDSQAIGAHFAGADRVIERLDLRAHEIDQLLVGLLVDAGPDLVTAVRVEGGSRRQLAGEAFACKESYYIALFGQVVGPYRAMRVRVTALERDRAAALRTQQNNPH